MAVIREAFNIPNDIAIKLLTGEYKRIGGVVRYAVGPNKGRIVKFLDPVDGDAANAAKGLGGKAIQFAKNNKTGVAVCGAIVGVVVIGEVVHMVKKHEPKVVGKFRKTLHKYVDEIREGRLELETVENLLLIIDEVKHHKNYAKIKIELTAEEIEVMVNRIYEFTLRFAEMNGVELYSGEIDRTDNAIINLERYLMVQKRIFEVA